MPMVVFLDLLTGQYVNHVEPRFTNYQQDIRALFPEDVRKKINAHELAEGLDDVVQERAKTWFTN